MGPKEDQLHPFEASSSQMKSAQIENTVGMVSEVAVKTSKNLGLSLTPSEDTVELPTGHTAERSTSSKVRNQSTERASLQGRAVGYMAEEEEPEHFDNKFSVRTSVAQEKNEKNKIYKKAQKMPIRGGQEVNEEN